LLALMSCAMTEKLAALLAESKIGERVMRTSTLLPSLR